MISRKRIRPISTASQWFKWTYVSWNLSSTLFGFGRLALHRNKRWRGIKIRHSIWIKGIVEFIRRGNCRYRIRYRARKIKVVKESSKRIKLTWGPFWVVQAMIFVSEGEFLFQEIPPRKYSILSHKKIQSFQQSNDTFGRNFLNMSVMISF